MGQRSRSMLLIVAAMLTISMMPPSPYAKKPDLTDVQAKLAIIYNFISRYVRWPDQQPAGATQDINICAVGSDELTKEIELLTKASTEKMRVNVLNNVALGHVRNCHVLYIAKSAAGDMPAFLATVQNYPVLTFSSADGFVDNGGMISFIRETQMQGAFERTFIRYEVNAVSVYNAKLYIDPDALELAKRVIR